MKLVTEADYFGSTLKGLYERNDMIWPKAAIVSTPEFFAVTAHHSMNASDLITLGLGLGQLLYDSIDNMQFPKLDDAIKKRLNGQFSTFYKCRKADIDAACGEKCFVPIYSGTSYFFSVLKRSNILALRDGFRKKMELDDDTAVGEIVLSYASGIERGLGAVTSFIPEYVV
ncbi:MAG: hypothetical protein NT016_03630 [Candidatus Aenigmarchaeota archaeon]|nr:hypothetical protein [Candidatus Aenigmarchaeota archaeon]